MNDEDARTPPEPRGDDEATKLAHDLRNPLGSALMALTILRARLTAADDLRLLDTLERNLRRVDLVIDERIAKPRLPRPEP